LIPFAALAIAAFWLDSAADRARCAAALLAYSATVLSFLGAIYWGFAMQQGQSATVKQQQQQSNRWLLLWGVLPSLVAWVALLLGSPAGLWLVTAALWGCFAVDSQIYPRLGLQGWLRIRLWLTLGASVSCATAGLSLM